MSACQRATARALASSSFSPDLSQLVRRVDNPSSHTSRPPAKKADFTRNRTRSITKSRTFPVAKNAYESNGRQWWGLPMRGEKRGKIRPAGTISREGMRAHITRQNVAVRLFAHNKTASCFLLHRLVATNWLQKACTETVYTVERETGLEPATACLEGRNSTTELLPHVLTKNS